MPVSRQQVDIYNADGTQIREKGALIDAGYAQSGSLPTASLSSGTGAQLSTTRDVTAYIAITLTNAAGTAVIALSPDGSTYSNLATITPAVNASVTMATVRVPAGWYIKVTVTQATITSTTYA